MHLDFEVHLDVSAAPERVFDVACDDRNLPRFYQRLGPIPGVTAQEPAVAESGELGRRTLTLSDGSSMLEVILARDRPHHYRYRWANAPAPPLHLLVRGAEAHWRFEAVGDRRTRIDCRYRFLLTSPLALGPALVVRALFRRWMYAALLRMKALSEQEDP
jgi:uncharacterized protein YndB with AHSA1/START domain